MAVKSTSPPKQRKNKEGTVFESILQRGIINLRNGMTYCSSPVGLLILFRQCMSQDNINYLTSSFAVSSVGYKFVLASKVIVDKTET
jgi:hypothetical protein